MYGVANERFGSTILLWASGTPSPNRKLDGLMRLESSDS